MTNYNERLRQIELMRAEHREKKAPPYQVRAIPSTILPTVVYLSDKLA